MVARAAASPIGAERRSDRTVRQARDVSCRSGEPADPTRWQRARSCPGQRSPWQEALSLPS